MTDINHSTCCNDTVRMGGDGGTHHYICNQCDQPCNVRMPEAKPNVLLSQEEIEQLYLQTYYAIQAFGSKLAQEQMKSAAKAQARYLLKVLKSKMEPAIGRTPDGAADKFYTIRVADLAEIERQLGEL